MEEERQLVFFKHYFKDFYEPLNDKIDQVLFLVRVAERIPKKFFKHLTRTDGLYEIRVEYQSNIYRVFCCFDKGNLVVLFNEFQKKSQKTPNREIGKASKIMNEYFELKKRSK